MFFKKRRSAEHFSEVLEGGAGGDLLQEVTPAKNARYRATSMSFPPTKATSASRSRSICAPLTPALTVIFSKSAAVASK